MRYTVTVAGLVFEVEVDGAEVSIDGRPVAAALRDGPGPYLRHAVVDGLGRTVALAAGPDHWTVHTGGERWTVEVADERARRLREVAGAAAVGHAGEVIKAPMPGLVLRVNTRVGEPVASGTAVVVLEAMKMENEIRASGPGTVAEVLVSPGAAVEKGTPLVEIGPVS